jgi:hypothetical protein
MSKDPHCSCAALFESSSELVNAAGFLGFSACHKEEHFNGSSNFAVGMKFYTENELEPGKPELPPSWLGFRNALKRSPK